MSARKRRSPVMEGESSSSSKRVRSPELDMYLDCVNPMFDPSRVLLRRVFFLDPEKTKYVSVGFYPSRNYQPLVEIGSPKSIPLILTDLHVKTLAEHLPAQCEALCRDEHYKVVDGDLKISSSATYKSAVISLSNKKTKKSINLRLSEIRHLSFIFFMIQNQLIKYTEAMSDVINCVLTTVGSTSYVEPPADANKNILYYQLFEEIKAIM